MIFGKIINEVDEYTLKDNIKPPKETNYTLDAGDGDVEPEEDTNNDPEPDNTDNNGEDNSEYSIDTPDEDPPRDTEEENTDDNTSEEDYTMGDNTGVEGDNNTNEDPENQDNLGGDDTVDGLENELLQKEKELFNKLSEKELDIKNSELKNNFEKVYKVIDDIKDKMKRIQSRPEIQNVVDFIDNKLTETQNDIEHYIYYTYENKSYLQNLKQYNFYLLILKNIEKLFLEIQPKNKN